MTGRRLIRCKCFCATRSVVLKTARSSISRSCRAVSAPDRPQLVACCCVPINICRCDGERMRPSRKCQPGRYKRYISKLYLSAVFAVLTETAKCATQNKSKTRKKTLQTFASCHFNSNLKIIFNVVTVIYSHNSGPKITKKDTGNENRPRG